jgi:hypothetical protein
MGSGPQVVRASVIALPFLETVDLNDAPGERLAELAAFLRNTNAAHIANASSI